jgi:membrane associated rhomboid family serine protease
MSIYEREYVRVGPHSKSGLGSLGLISVNSWIIIANVAVFIINFLLIARPVPVTIDLRMSRPTRLAETVGDGVLRDQVGNPIPTEIRQLVQGSRGPEVRAIPNPAFAYGGGGYMAVYDKATHEVIGMRHVQYQTVLEAWGHFSTARGFFGIEIWRFITFQFLHANISHILFNMFGLWVFGGMVEQYLGSKRYLAFYLTCGIFGAVSYLILNSLGSAFPSYRIPGVLPDSIYTPLIGASAGVFGVIMACAYIAPSAIVMLLFPPIPLKLKWMAYGYLAIAAWNLLRGGANAGGDAAHVGGAIAGAFFIRRAHLLRDFFDVFGPRRAGAGGRAAATNVPQAELDRILAKVAQQGLRSLTESEKRTLREASERMRR